jgi:hypothetical protein
LGWPRGRSGRTWILPGFDPKTVELFTVRYTDRAIPAASTSEKARIKIVELVGKLSVSYGLKDPVYSKKGKFSKLSCALLYKMI